MRRTVPLNPGERHTKDKKKEDLLRARWLRGGLILLTVVALGLGTRSIVSKGRSTDVSEKEGKPEAAIMAVRRKPQGVRGRTLEFAALDLRSTRMGVGFRARKSEEVSWDS